VKPLPGRSVTSHAEKLAGACKRCLRERALVRAALHQTRWSECDSVTVSARDWSELLAYVCPFIVRMGSAARAALAVTRRYARGHEPDAYGAEGIGVADG
jgi:hypothetical protein